MRSRWLIVFFGSVRQKVKFNGSVAAKLMANLKLMPSGVSVVVGLLVGDGGADRSRIESERGLVVTRCNLESAADHVKLRSFPWLMFR